MLKLEPYLKFNGNCEGAFNFYKSIFRSEFERVMCYKEIQYNFSVVFNPYFALLRISPHHSILFITKFACKQYSLQITAAMIIPLFAGLGGPEVIIIIFLVLLLFGGKKIPELMKGLGKGVKSFKAGMNEEEESLHSTQETITENPEKSDNAAPLHK